MTSKKLIFIFSGILLLGLLIQFWLIYFSKFNIPEHIPHTPINLGGLGLILSLILILIFFAKESLKRDNTLSIYNLTISGTIVCFISEFLFQLIKQFAINSTTFKERLIDFSIGVLGITFFAAVISFFVAFQIKTKKTGMLLLFIATFMALAALLKSLAFPK